MDLQELVYQSQYLESNFAEENVCACGFFYIVKAPANKAPVNMADNNSTFVFDGIQSCA